MPDRPVLVSMPLSHIVTFWRPGSHDWTWADEYADLMDPANEVTQRILKRVAAEGIDFVDHVAPVLLGSDGRVWDGHHRICIALHHRIPSLMVETTIGLPVLTAEQRRIAAATDAPPFRRRKGDADA